MAFSTLDSSSLVFLWADTSVSDCASDSVTSRRMIVSGSLANMQCPCTASPSLHRFARFCWPQQAKPSVPKPLPRAPCSLFFWEHGGLHVHVQKKLQMYESALLGWDPRAHTRPASHDPRGVLRAHNTQHRRIDHLAVFRPHHADIAVQACHHNARLQTHLTHAHTHFAGAHSERG